MLMVDGSGGVARRVCGDEGFPHPKNGIVQRDFDFAPRADDVDVRKRADVCLADTVLQGFRARVGKGTRESAPGEARRDGNVAFDFGAQLVLNPAERDWEGWCSEQDKAKRGQGARDSHRHRET